MDNPDSSINFLKIVSEKAIKVLFFGCQAKTIQSTRFRDALATQISKDFNIDIQEYQPAFAFFKW